MPYHPPQEDTPHLPLDFIALPAQTSVNNTTTRHRDARRVASQQPQQQGVSNPPLAHAYHRVREASLPQLEPSPNPQPYPVPSAASAASQQPIPTKQKKEILGGLVAGRTRKIVLGLLVLVAIAVAVGVVVSKNKAEKDSNNNKGDFNASPPGGSTTLPPPSSATSSSITLSVATATSTPTTTTTAPPPPLNTFEIYLQCTKNTVIDLNVLSQQQQRDNQRSQPPVPSTSNATGQVSGAFVPVPHAPGRSRPRRSRRWARNNSGAANPGDGNNNNNNNNTSEKVPCPRHMPGHGPNRFVTRSLGQKRVLSLFYASDVALVDAILAYRRDNPTATVDDAIDAFDEYQSADALANIVYETQAFDMVFKYPIPEHLRKVPQEPPVLDPAPNVSDIEIDSQSSAAQRRRAERLEQEQQAEALKRQATMEQLHQKELLRQEKQDAQQLGWTHIDVPTETDGTKSSRQIEDERLEKERYRFKKALMKENLIIEEEPDIDGEEMYVKVYTPFWRLCVEAQRQRYKAVIA
ncbi:hypothetical protein BGZ73_003430, partial [Actinomortierella ambigua]